MPASTPKPKLMEAFIDKSKTSKNGSGSGPIFVRCELNKEQKEGISFWHDGISLEDIAAWIEKMVLNSHVVSIRSNEVGFQCSVTGVREVSGHENQSLVARASTPWKAVVTAMYKDIVILDGKWPKTGLLEELDY